jgi:hypothetical protein
MLTGDPERDGDEAEVAPLRQYWADVPGSAEDAARELLGWWSAFADSAYAFERIVSAKVTIRPRTSSHSAWRDARNPSARVSTDATAKHGCAPWQASSR